MKILNTKEALRMVVEEDLITQKVDLLKTKMLEGLKKSKSEAVILDLCKVNYIDSAGIKLVIGLFKSCTERNLTLQVEVASSQIIRLFSVCKLNNFFEIKEVQPNG